MRARSKAVVLALLAASASIADDAQPSPECILEGIVRAGDRPVGGVTVTLQAGQKRTRAETAPDGTFRFTTAYSGPATAGVERVTDGGRAFARMERAVTLQPQTAARADLDLMPGTASITGTLSRNGLPTPKGSAVVIARLFGTSTYTACVLTDANGRYRLEGLPAGSHQLQLDARPTILSVAIAHMRKSTHDTAVVLADGETLPSDFDLETGRLIARLSGLRSNEAGRLVLIEGEFSGPRLTQTNVGMLLRRVASSSIIQKDQYVALNDLSTGTYTAFLAAYDRRAGSLAEAFKTMRVAYAIVVIERDQESTIDLAAK